MSGLILIADIKNKNVFLKDRFKTLYEESCPRQLVKKRFNVNEVDVLANKDIYIYIQSVQADRLQDVTK